jgi:acetaldehyde dehydrogenase (acetylating)
VKTRVAVIGSGNIGTDLMIKVMRLSKVLEMGALIGIDADSPGLERAARLGVPISAKGVEGLVSMSARSKSSSMRHPRQPTSATMKCCVSTARRSST